MAVSHQELGLLSTLVISLVAAFAGGLFVRSLRLPPLLGYLLAGVAIGPFTPGIIANQSMANELAEIGVALLLFNIGLHFSFKDLLAARSIVLPGALFQVAFTTIAGAAVAHFLLSISVATSVAVGLSMAIASTAVATRILDERHQLSSLAGRIALGWLVVQDLIVIVGLVLLPVLGKTGEDGVGIGQLMATLGKTLFQVAGFVAIMVVGGRRFIPWVLRYVARIGSRELFTLAVIVMALGIAYGSSIIFGVSLALGAFFAGVVIGESDLNHHAAAEAVAMQQVFTILFFVSVGMLFDPRSLVQMPLDILAFLLTIVVGMGLITFFVLLFFKVPLQAAALVGATFSQIGEFSFVLSQFGFQTGFYGQRERDLIIAVALLSILVNPLLLSVVTRLSRWVAGLSWYQQWQSSHVELSMNDVVGISNHAILVGHGRVGGIIAKSLRELRVPYVSIEADRSLTESLRAKGEDVIFGDAAREAVMAAARPEHARLVIIAVPDPHFAKQIVRCVRRLHSSVAIVARTHADDEARALTKLGVNLAVMAERELAFGMMQETLLILGHDDENVKDTIAHIRGQAYNLDRSE